MSLDENKTTIEQVKVQLERELKAMDKKIEKAIEKVDGLTKERSYTATLLEKVNRVEVK